MPNQVADGISPPAPALTFHSELPLVLMKSKRPVTSLRVAIISIPVADNGDGLFEEISVVVYDCHKNQDKKYDRGIA